MIFLFLFLIYCFYSLLCLICYFINDSIWYFCSFWPMFPAAFSGLPWYLGTSLFYRVSSRWTIHPSRLPFPNKYLDKAFWGANVNSEFPQLSMVFPKGIRSFIPKMPHPNFVGADVFLLTDGHLGAISFLELVSPPIKVAISFPRQRPTPIRCLFATRSPPNFLLSGIMGLIGGIGLCFDLSSQKTRPLKRQVNTHKMSNRVVTWGGGAFHPSGQILANHPRHLVPDGQFPIS